MSPVHTVANSTLDPQSSVLIANRGEIAVRVARAARALGLRSVAVYSDADRAAPHVRACDDAVAIGGSLPAESYLRIDKLLAAARSSGAQAIHPGYGFLAESAAFAQAVIDAGLVFIGPRPASIAAMGDKSEARRRAAALGIPVLAGYDGAEQDDATLLRAAGQLGYPLMIKAVAGGGGRGMRLVPSAAALEAALASARAEALAAFGDGRLLLERALPAPRHVEVQVLADAHGQAVFLGERDCSVQRRHQKIVEEAPCPVLAPGLRRALGAAALQLARAIDYVGAGTVEFLLDGERFHFMEMNTRLQVEHPVTEALTGVDLVQWQLRIAQGDRLTLAQEQVLERFEHAGHAIEVRLCAEDPAAGFLPRTGRIVRWSAPADIRIDHALESGLDVSPFYDSLLGKLIAFAPTRTAAALQLAATLDRTIVFGVPTNRAFLARVLRHPAFIANGAGDGVSTAFIDRHWGDAAARAVSPRPAHWALAAFIGTRFNATPWPDEWRGWTSTGTATASFRLALADADSNREVHGTVEGSGCRHARVRWQSAGAAGDVTVEVGPDLAEGQWTSASVDGHCTAIFFERTAGRLWLQADGIEASFIDRRLQPSTQPGAGASNGAIAAPIHGRVVQVTVRAGDRVQKGAALVTLEAMKMEHALLAAAAGTVRAVFVQAGDQVAAGRIILDIELDPAVARSDSTGRML